MSVYVDVMHNHGGNAKFPYPSSCHMYADTIEELHAMAAQIGMKRAWFQPKKGLGMDHYDLVISRRRKAVKLGAIEHDRHQMVAFMRAQREIINNLFTP